MANFQTHLLGGALVSGAGALAVYAQGLTSASETQTLFLLGTAASLLPDIDANDSRPVRIAFDAVGIVVGFLVAFAFARHLKLLELLLIWLGTWLFVRYPLRASFSRFTVHRGVWHTLLMALTLALATAVIAHRGLGLEALSSWLAGGFMLLGYLTHLLLDELASVDLLGHSVKRSFGTALKPLSLRAWPASLLLALLSLGFLLLAPDLEVLMDWASAAEQSSLF